MGTVPTTKAARIAFYEQHIAQWTSSATSIGLTTSDCSALQALIETARLDFTDQGIAAEAAKGATATSNASVASMHSLGSALLLKIRSFAEATNSPNVYVLAGIPAPAGPSPVPPPGKPQDFTAEILSTGALQLGWKCPNPTGAAGTVYEVRRKIGSAPFAMIGAGGSDRRFVDDTLPLGSSLVTYEITGLRGTTRGPSIEFNVRFGVAGGGGGGFAVTSVEEVPTVQAKMAA